MSGKSVGFFGAKMSYCNFLKKFILKNEACPNLLKNSLLILGIYTENKTSADCA
jgi:hypothetical protein